MFKKILAVLLVLVAVVTITPAISECETCDDDYVVRGKVLLLLAENGRVCGTVSEKEDLEKRTFNYDGRPTGIQKNGDVLRRKYKVNVIACNGILLSGTEVDVEIRIRRQYVKALEEVLGIELKGECHEAEVIANAMIHFFSNSVASTRFFLSRHTKAHIGEMITIKANDEYGESMNLYLGKWKNKDKCPKLGLKAGVVETQTQEPCPPRVPCPPYVPCPPPCVPYQPCVPTSTQCVDVNVQVHVEVEVDAGANVRVCTK